MFKTLKDQKGYGDAFVIFPGVILAIGIFFGLLYALDEFFRWANTLPPPRIGSFVSYYNQVFSGWPFWSGVGLLFLLLAWSFIFPSSFASFFGAERRQNH